MEKSELQHNLEVYHHRFHPPFSAYLLTKHDSLNRKTRKRETIKRRKAQVEFMLD